MKTELVYVEELSPNHNGQAWIGKCFFSKSGQTIYFNGRIYKRGQGVSGNHYDLETGYEFWISGIKKKGTNRHNFGNGFIDIDKTVVEDYLALTEQTELKKSKFRIVELDNIPAKEKATEILNEKLENDFNDAIRFKNVNDLSSAELESLINYYEEQDVNDMYKKNRKYFIEALNELRAEQNKRQTWKYI